MERGGPFLLQHDVDILNNHQISVFNNRAIETGSRYGYRMIDGFNEVTIYNFEKNGFSSYLKNSLIQNEVRTRSQGRSQILPNGDLFVEETNYGRTLYFNRDGSQRWTHVNRAENGNVYKVAWSRILYSANDIQIVNNFLDSRGTCNE